MNLKRITALTLTLALLLTLLPSALAAGESTDTFCSATGRPPSKPPARRTVRASAPAAGAATRKLKAY